MGNTTKNDYIVVDIQSLTVSSILFFLHFYHYGKIYPEWEKKNETVIDFFFIFKLY